jgi:prophage antirepressor-like protein
MLNVKKVIYQERFGQKMPTLVAQDDTHWYPASDICSILGFKNHRDAVKNHLKSAHTTYALRGKEGAVKRVVVINESGVSRLMFKSKAPIAVELVNKIFDTVLPSIREEGGYVRDFNLFRRFNN